MPPDADGGACDGPTFEFGENDRLAWTTYGILVRQETKYAIDLGLTVRFTTSRMGSANVRWVTLACEGCEPAESNQFEGKLEPLVGKRVYARGIVRPAWPSASDAGPSLGRVAVILGAKVDDVGAVVPRDAGAPAKKR